MYRSCLYIYIRYFGPITSLLIQRTRVGLLSTVACWTFHIFFIVADIVLLIFSGFLEDFRATLRNSPSCSANISNFLRILSDFLALVFSHCLFCFGFSSISGEKAIRYQAYAVTNRIRSEINSLPSPLFFNKSKLWMDCHWARIWDFDISDPYIFQFNKSLKWITI